MIICNVIIVIVWGSLATHQYKQSQLLDVEWTMIALPTGYSVSLFLPSGLPVS